MRLYNVYVLNMFYKTTLGKKIEKFLYSLITLLFLKKALKQRNKQSILSVYLRNVQYILN